MVTVHRAENLDNVGSLSNILSAVAQAEWPAVFPLHPHTRESLSKIATPIGDRIRFIKPVSYRDMLLLEKYACAILTDSGGVEREACWAGVPCLTLRDTTEWVELVEAGYCRLVGADCHRIQAALDEMESCGELRRSESCRDIFGAGSASKEIVRILVDHIVCHEGAR